MRALWTLLRLEGLRLARTSQVYTYVVLPALLVLPSGVFLGLAAFSLRQAPTVAVPGDLPASLPLVEALEEEELEVRVVADPRAAFLAGEVEGAVLAVDAGEGLSTARTELELAEPATWVVHVAGADAGLERSLEAAVEAAGDEVLADLVALAGAAPERDLWVARIDSLEVEEAPPFSVERGLWAYVVFVVSMVGFFFLSLAGVADRSAGLTETLLATPVRARTVLAARLLAVLGLQVVACLLLAANVVLLLSNAGDALRLPGTSPAMVLSLLGATALCDALYLVVGTWTPSAKAANNVGGAVMMAVLALLGLGVVRDVPAFLPLAGVVSAETPVAHLVAGASSGALAVVIVALAAAALERRVDLKLASERS